MVLSPGLEDIGSYQINMLLSDGSGGDTVFVKNILVEENLFPDLSVSASQTVNYNLAAYTLDGYFDTYWQSNEIGSSLIYDLGNEYIIDTVKIAFYNAEDQKYSFSVFSSVSFSLHSFFKSMTRTFLFSHVF